YAGMTAVPAYPPRPNRGLSRIQSIVADAEASVALTSAALLAKTQTMMVHTPDLQKLAWVATDSIEAGWENEWKPVSLSPEDLAFLQYTSGSTGIPRGVMVSHANIMQNEEAMRRCMECAPERPGVSWLPPYHDMGLIGMLQAVYTGFHGVLMAPTAFLQKPLRWLKAISKYRGFVSGAPDFAYDLCARKITEEEKAGLDLSCWEVAYNGAETIRSETVNRFAESFRSCGFHAEAMHPCYGLAEATLIVSGGRKPTGPAVKTILSEPFKYNRIEAAEHETDQTRSLVGCGVNLFEQQIVIANPDTLTRCQDLQVGEVWVAGKTVARGYWNRPEETRSTFQAFLADTGEGPFLRTGDLGFLDAGELYVTGRIKDLIIIHGQNYYPQDIELTVERSHRSLRSISGAAVSVEIGGVERLVIVQELEFRQKPDLNEVITAIRQAVAKEHELQCHAVAIIKPGSIAKTSSGKIRRHACKKAFLANELEIVDGGLWQAAFEPVSIPAPAAELPVTPTLKAHPGTVHTIARWLVEQVAQLAKIPATEVDVRQPFAFYGLSSIDAVNLAGDLEKVLGIPISPTLVWDYPTIDAVSNHLATLENLTFHPPQKSETAEAIAIVGIGCRFGGHASSPEAFWDLLKNGVDAVTEIPPSRWDVNAFYDPDPAAPGKSNCRFGSFVDHFDEFDPLFFNISPREAACIDPQHRVLIETTWEALESAGLPPNRLAGSETGVFVGISSNDYSLVQARYANREQTVEAYPGLGNAHSIAANRLSYLFNLRGPSMAVDTACSSSLVAVHLACQSILNGECNLAIAGGVNLILSPEPTISFSKARMLSPDGRCKTFDAAANGYVRGEGCGVIVLKRLSDAQRNGDHILAIIRGSAINQDGLTNGLTAPNGPSQQAVIRKAIKAARVSPTDISYVEAHGTGTPLGDPIEVQALAAVISENRPASHPCVIGSVKTNLGHLEAAAGIAGLIKTVLALHHRQIPPHLHFQQPNPNLSLEPNKLTVPRTLTTWNPINHKRLAGVSSFGFGGTNAHIILEEAPALLPQSGRDQTTHVLTLSAQSESALRRLAGEYSEFLTRQPGHLVGNVCFSANTGRALFSHRLTILGETTEHFRTGLATFAAGTTTQAVQTQTVKGTIRQKVAFLFGATQADGARISRQSLTQSSIYSQAFTHCVQLGQQAAMTSDDTDLLTFADSIALAEVWKAFGVLPGAVLGQETGELAAAVVAGCCSIETAIAVLAARRRALDQLPTGGMTIQVATSGAHVTTFLQSGTSGVTIAGVCSPEHTLVAGEHSAIAAFMTRLAAAGISSQIVHPRLALHSPLVEPVLAGFEQSIQTLSFEEPQIPMISGVTGRQLDGVPDAMYWRQQLRQMLKLTPAFDTLSELGFETFIVIEPTCQLLTIGKQSLGETFGTWLPGAGQAGSDDWRTLLQGLTYLYLNGTDIEWSAAYRDLPRRRIGLPTYPFDRHRYWVEPPVIAELQTVAAPPALTFEALAASIAEVSIRTLAENGESPTEADVNLFDAQGRLVVSLPGRRISQTIKTDSLPDSSWFYELRWKEISHPATVSQSETPGSWIIFTHRNKFGRALTALLEAAGETCTVIKPGAAYDNTGEDEIEINRERAEDYDQLFAEALKPGCRGVLFLWGLDEKGMEAGGQGIDA
ncbi:MAG TPA: beta-ketoacyl synthase N-terminal-like domain-containing protein, partial [Acidobacteriota bacterium]|nr:beta-ketoacyl synthase N-terminal-like domain-containing protein [Acidobacteriota bacterium]